MLRTVAGRLARVNTTGRTGLYMAPCGGRTRMFRSRTTAAEPHTVKIEISDPTAILRALATRYESSTRILMEYVDNSLDSAEEARRQAASGELTESVGYPWLHHIHIGIDRKKRRIWVSDNCEGIDPESLTRLASRIGESQKRGVAWLNGQFGFGLQAFRAAADSLRVYSAHKGEPLHFLSLSREEISVPTPIPMDTAGLVADNVVGHAVDNGLLGPNVDLTSGKRVNGTAIVLDKIDPVWFRSLTKHSIVAEIEHHFESLLRRDNLTVTVSDSNSPDHVQCMPFDYSQVEGHHIQREIEGSGGHTPVKCNLIVSKRVVDKKRPRFFKQGRCIGPVADTKSFIKGSAAGDELWGHPALCGYIEIGSVLEPVITRDEFVKSKERDELYGELALVEDELKVALAQMIEQHKDESLEQLEDVLGDSITKVVRNDAAFFRALSGSDDTTKAKDTPTPKTIVKDNVEYKTIKRSEDPSIDKTTVERTKRKPPIDVKFVSAPAEGDTDAVRSFESGSVLYVNIAHPDFIERQHKDHKGRLRYNSRIAAYLAAEVACHYKKAFYEKHKRTVPSERRRLYEELMDSVHAMESVLTAKIGTLERKARTSERWSSDKP